MSRRTRMIAASLVGLLAAASTWALFSDSATSGATDIKAGKLSLVRCEDSWNELSADADQVSSASPESLADFEYQPGDSLDIDYCIQGVAKGDNLAGVLDVEWGEVAAEGDTFVLYTDSSGSSGPGTPIAGGPVGTDVRITEAEDSRLAATWGDTERTIRWVLRIHRESQFDPAELSYTDDLDPASGSPAAESPDIAGFQVTFGQTRIPVFGNTGDLQAVIP